MPLSATDAEDQAEELMDVRARERTRLEKIFQYVSNTQRLTWLPRTVPQEVRELARLSRVNMLKLVVNSPTQAMYVDGFKRRNADFNEEVWGVWQQNRFDKRQIGVHRAGITFGASYVTVLPGDPVPILRGASPRNLTVAYGEDDDWPDFALEQRNNGLWRLYDETHVYNLKGSKGGGSFELLDSYEHEMGVTPVVRYLYTDDLDQPVTGIVEGLIELQDQINITTFGLLVAQHYGAFKQRYILGWLAETEEEKIQASASRIWTFEDSPSDIEIGELTETDVKGYIESRESTLRHIATISQTPAHELLGQLVNLSAEALAAAEASHRRAVEETQTVMGESHEQVLTLAGEYEGVPPDPFAEVIWRDTESRSLAQVADALGKLVMSLGVPPQELWEKIPGVTQSEVRRWKAAAGGSDIRTQFAELLNRQASEAAAIGLPVERRSLPAEEQTTEAGTEGEASPEEA